MVMIICSDSDICSVRDGSMAERTALAVCVRESLLPKPRRSLVFYTRTYDIFISIARYPRQGNKQYAHRMEKCKVAKYCNLTSFTMFMLMALTCVRATVAPNRRTDRTCSPTRLTPSRTSTMCTSWTCRRWRGHSASPCPRG